MPIYDYRCRKCGHDFQITQRMSDHDKARPKCPGCGSRSLERVFTGAFVKTGKKG